VTARPLTLLMLLLAAASLQAQRYYRSDELGAQGALASEEDRDGQEWVLRVEQAGEQTLRTLLRDGVESEQSVYRDGKLVTHTRYDSAGEVTVQQRFRYWRDGSLRMVERTDNRRVLFRYRDGVLVSEERTDDALRERHEYDLFGRTAARELWLDGELAEQENRTYWGEPPLGIRRIELTQGAVTRVEQYAQSGELIGSQQLVGGAPLREVERFFRNDRLVSEREMLDGQVYESRYRYEGDTLVEQSSFVDDELIERVLYHQQQSITRTQIIFRDGEPLLEVDYADERRLQERVIRDGAVVRVRTFEPEADG
jgi:hypothetical protein